MQPIQDLLHRIQWDADFGRGAFVIGYLDHAAPALVRIPWSRVRFEHGEHFSLDVQDENGRWQMVPLHRVRAVWCDGRLIWQR